MTNNDYTAHLALLWHMAHQIATAPIVAPSLWALGGQRLAQDIALMEEMLRVKRMALSMRGGDAR